MKLSRRSRTLVLWLIAIGLLVGMVISFTPTMGLGGANAAQGTPQLIVNGETVREAAVLSARQNALFSAVSEGEVADDLELILVDELIRDRMLSQAASRMSVSGGEVRQAVEDFRSSRGVSGRGNDQAYLSILRSSGFTDETFRTYLRQQLQINKFYDGIAGSVTVSDEEIEAYYLSHALDYQSEPRILARQIVVADVETARELRERVLDGASFADLAAEHSLELADRRGALGAPTGETEPRPVSRPALPTAVANAAFALAGAGLTDVIEAPGGAYLIQVDSYLPAETQPFDEVRDRVADDALIAKQAGVVEAELERLRAQADVSFPGTSSLSFNDVTLAQVGDVEITRTQLARATYLNPQIQQALSPQTADLIANLFKPAVLQQLIDTEVAYQGAATLGVPLVGTRAGVAQAARDYVARDAGATEAEIQDYYQTNIAAFRISAEAEATLVELPTAAAAQAFRARLIAGEELGTAIAELSGGTVEVLGRVLPGQLDPDLDTALFQTDAFVSLPGGELEVSDVLVIVTEVEPSGAGEGAEDAADTGDVEGEEGELLGDGAATESDVETVESYVVLVAKRTPETVRTLEAVRAQITNSVISINRNALQNEWLDEVRSGLDVREFALFGLLDQFDFLTGAGLDPAEDPADEDADAAADGEADGTADDAADDQVDDAGDDAGDEAEVEDDSGSEFDATEASDDAGDADGGSEGSE